MKLREVFDQQQSVSSRDNPTDTLTVDVPLMIRLMEYAKEDAIDDTALHQVAERLTQLAAQGKTLTMSDYDMIVGGADQQEQQMDVPQENEEQAVSRKSANRASTIAKLKQDYADKLRWSAEEKQTKGADRSGHAAGAMRIKAHLKNQYGVDV